MITIADLLACKSLLDKASDSSMLDVELLLCHCLNKNRTYLRTWPEREIDEDTVVAFNALLERRLGGEPIAYLIGSRGFWTLDLAVNESTLIPRPETELLVEQALACLNNLPQTDTLKINVLDLGTGSGAVALAIAAENNDWQVLGSDKHSEPLVLAEKNRHQHKLANVSFVQSDWFADLAPQCFDLIVSNPPYIDQNDPHLQQGDVRFEPRSALVAANKGLADIEHIAAMAKSYLKPQGRLIFEHGYDQARAVRGIMASSGFKSPYTVKDLSGNDRITQAIINKHSRELGE